MIKKILMIAVFALASVTVASASNGKVTICHMTHSTINPTVIISVSSNAVPAQLAQGSTIATELPDGTYTCNPVPPPDPV